MKSKLPTKAMGFQSQVPTAQATLTAHNASLLAPDTYSCLPVLEAATMMTQLLSWDHAAYRSELIKPPGLQSSPPYGSGTATAKCARLLLRLLLRTTAFQDNQNQHLLLLLRIHLLSSLPQLLPWQHDPMAVLFHGIYLRCSQADLELLVLWPQSPNSCDKRPVL